MTVEELSNRIIQGDLFSEERRYICTQNDYDFANTNIAHYGVKGMRWGVRKSDDAIRTGKSSFSKVSDEIRAKRAKEAERKVSFIRDAYNTDSQFKDFLYAHNKEDAVDNVYKNYDAFMSKRVGVGLSDSDLEQLDEFAKNMEEVWMEYMMNPDNYPNEEERNAAKTFYEMMQKIHSGDFTSHLPSISYVTVTINRKPIDTLEPPKTTEGLQYAYLTPSGVMNYYSPDEIDKMIDRMEKDKNQDFRTTYIAKDTRKKNVEDTKPVKIKKYPTDIAHYGVLGMKWGVRKDRQRKGETDQQYKDRMDRESRERQAEKDRKARSKDQKRSLKAQERQQKRVLRSQERTEKARQKAELAKTKANLDAQAKQRRDLQKQLERQEKRKVKEEKKKSEKNPIKPASMMSDDELKDAVLRLQNMKKYKDLTKKPDSLTMKVAKGIGGGILVVVGKNIATKILTDYGTEKAKDVVEKKIHENIDKKNKAAGILYLPPHNPKK